MLGIGSPGQSRSQLNQFSNNLPEFAGAHSIGRNTLHPFYATSPMMQGAEGSGAGFVISEQSSHLKYIDDFYRRSSSAGTPSSARSTPISSPGISGPIFDPEMTANAQYRRDAGSWLTYPGLDHHYDHPGRRSSP